MNLTLLLPFLLAPFTSANPIFTIPVSSSASITVPAYHPSSVTTSVLSALQYLSGSASAPTSAANLSNSVSTNCQDANTDNSPYACLSSAVLSLLKVPLVNATYPAGASIDPSSISKPSISEHSTSIPSTTLINPAHPSSKNPTFSTSPINSKELRYNPQTSTPVSPPPDPATPDPAIPPSIPTLLRGDPSQDDLPSNNILSDLDLPAAILWELSLPSLINLPSIARPTITGAPPSSIPIPVMDEMVIPASSVDSLGLPLIKVPTTPTAVLDLDVPAGKVEDLAIEERQQ